MSWNGGDPDENRRGHRPRGTCRAERWPDLGRCRRQVLLCDDEQLRNRASQDIPGLLGREGIRVAAVAINKAFAPRRALRLKPLSYDLTSFSAFGNQRQNSEYVN